MGCQYCGRENEEDIVQVDRSSKVELADGTMLVAPAQETSLLCDFCGILTREMTFEEEYIVEEL